MTASGYSIDWEADEILQHIRMTLDFLDKGCMYKMGCKTKQCSCQKNGRSCGAGCECRGCTNMQISCLQHQEETFEDDEEEEDSEEEDEHEDIEDEDLQTEIITDMMTDEDANIVLFCVFPFTVPLFNC